MLNPTIIVNRAQKEEIYLPRTYTTTNTQPSIPGSENE